MDYEPLEQVRKITLDYKVEQRIKSIQDDQQRVQEQHEETKAGVANANERD
jgi:hypothetical protein